ncbi:hypothetical protein CLHOM_00280 [Clostridium homopropionicum DSM 5847]|uniref:Uncharacterized protein n=1 Tax=Clostridium homopropionicum DSM 5847 TaxID=1121318 RepID=A0A0L6ZEH9_9CLOT|nr:hypothetical protein [Clostridium homopropionicum]KOA21357.1 hypothetical protein CLHOM_00280 [Clostridium homopropionicum DSM 5847]SFG12462.1 hypothetical protein SAMN04488501_105198 [Clostridium homopropionicum]
MDNNNVSINMKTIEKIINELKEIQNLTPEDAVKYRVNNLIEILAEVTNFNSEESIEDIIYLKMKEAMSKNPDLHVKLYMLYRGLNDGKISKEEAKEMYQNYVQMYPFDSMIY